MFAVAEFRQVFALLIVRTVSVDLIDAQIRMCTVTQTYGSACSTKLFHDQDVIEVTATRSAVVFIGCDTEEA